MAFTPDELMAASFSLIDDVDIVVIELSEKGVGLGIEAGYAFARSIPIVVLHRAGTDVSATLAGIAAAIHSYDDDASLDLAAAGVRAVADR